MARRLKGGMPKLFKDNRCPAAKRFREIYEDVEKRFLLPDGTLYISVDDDDRPAEIFLQLKGSNCSAELIERV